ncbi:MAG: DUF4125 family protein, partial [Clostridiales bacterium]|nr:DUF4125 family protein [Clostridiales bacterium]
IRHIGESTYVTSFETYTKGELLTYSLDTLRIFYQYYEEKKSRGESIYKETIENTVKQLGFKSLEQAEESQRSKKIQG